MKPDFIQRKCSEMKVAYIERQITDFHLTGFNRAAHQGDANLLREQPLTAFNRPGIREGLGLIADRVDRSVRQSVIQLLDL